MAADGSIIIDTKLDSSGLSGGLSKLSGVAKGALGGVAAAIGAVSAGLAAAGGFAIKAGMDFEAGMSRVKAISGATSEEFSKLNELAKQLGADTSFSASEAAQGMENLAAAGFTVNEITDAMPGLLDLAAASGEDLAGSSEIAASALRAFGLDASEAGHVADVLAANANRTNASVMDTGYAFRYVAPLAKALGISMEETAASIGILSNAGIKGEQAGTTLRGALTRLVKPTKKAQEAMDSLGVSFFDSQGKMLPLNEIIGVLSEATAGLSDQQKNAALTAIFGTESLSGMLALIDAGPEKLAELTAAYQASDGAAKEAAATMQDNLKGAVEQLTGSLETLGIEVYESWQEPLKKAALAGVDYVNQLTDAFKSGGLSGLVEELGTVFADLAVKAAEASPQMIDAAVKLISAFLSGIAKNKDKLFAAAGEIVKALADGMTKLLPKQLQAPVKAAIDAITKSFQSGGLKKAVQTVQNLFQSLGDAIGKVAKTVLPIFTKAVDFLAGNLDKLAALVTAVVVGMKAWSVISTATAALKKMQEATRLASLALNEFILKNGAEAVAAAAATGALTLKQVAVGLLTGKIGLATAAQWLWNAAMSANPIGIVITVVAALAAGIAVLCAAQNDGAGSAELFAESEERLAESSSRLTETFAQSFQAANDFITGVSGAGSVFDGFNDAIIVSNERQQELSSRMDAVQGEITEIARIATEERRELTATEIQRLEELFAEMQKLSEQELAIQQAYQQAVKTIAEDTAADHEMSLEEYTAYSQKLIHSAQETKEELVAKAEEQKTELYILAQNAYSEQKTMTETEYQEARAAAQEGYTAAVTEANALYADTLTIIRQGYADRTQASQENAAALKQIAEEQEAESRKNAAAIAEIEKQRKSNFEEAIIKMFDFASSADGKLEAENTRHNNEMSRLQEEASKNLEGAQGEQLLTWTAMLADCEMYGGKIEAKDQATVTAILEIFKKLPPESRAQMEESMKGMLGALEAEEPSLFAKAASIAGGIISKLQAALNFGGGGSDVPQYASGTKYHPGGLAIVGERGPELVALPRGSRVFSHGEYDRMRSAVALEQSRIAAAPAAAVNYTAAQSQSHSEDNRKTEINNYVETGGNPSGEADAKKLARELGRQTEHEMRRRGLIPT